MRTILISLCAAVVMLGIASADPSGAKQPHSASGQPQPAQETDWASNPALADDLGPESQIRGYAFRVPKGYSDVKVPTDLARKGFEFHLFAGERRSDGTVPGIALIIATPPQGTSESISLDQAVDGNLDEKKHSFTHFVQSPVQEGRLDGLKFERVYFKGLYIGTNATHYAHGLIYVTVANRDIVSFQAEDAEPYSSDTLPLFEASVLTFHRVASTQQ